MATEKLLVKTKDNCVLAFDITFSNEAERLRLVHECENIGANLNYRNNETPTYSSAITPDDANTKFLNQEISGYHYRKNRSRFSNRMRRDPPVQPNTLYISHQINDDAFPEMIKNLGFEIKPVDKHYRVHYNPATQEFDPEPEFVKTVMSVNSGKRMVSVVRNHFQFEPQDYRLLENIIQKYKRAQQTNAHLSEDEFIDSLPDKKSRRLFRIYSAEVDRNHDRQTSINHELKHIANSIFMAGLSLKKDNKRLQIEDYYRIAMEDERSAYLGELVDNINTYLKNGNFDDFSMFTSNNSRCVVELKRLRTPAERQAYAMNWPHLVAQKMAYFEEEQRAFYDGNQIPRNLQIYADKAPLSVPADTDRSAFKKLRSLFYIYQLYNPATHRMEQVNLAQYITPELEVTIDADKQQRIIEPIKAVLHDRLQEYALKVQKGEVDTNLIEPAKKLMRSNVSNREFITHVDHFRVAQLYEPEGNEPTPTPTPTPTSTPSPVPADHADWSDDLQRYWQQADGYKQLAKNNNEYKFKIKDATVRYTSKKQAEISDNADYSLYDKMLKEPSNRAAPVEFLDTLSKEQKLMLYIACVNNGRKMVGKVPTDLSGISRLHGIPETELNKFNHRQRITPQPTQQSRSGRNSAEMSSAMRQAELRRKIRGR